MLTIPNFLSLLRIPLAFCFLQSSPILRAVSVLIAMVTDCLDGFIARRFKMESKAGVFLDPAMDKFFVLFIVITFLNEGSLGFMAAMALLSRDFAVMLFGFYLTTRGQLWNYKFRSIWCGKATTALQFIVLFLLNFGVIIPFWVYGAFVGLGALALVELYLPTATRVYSKLDN